MENLSFEDKMKIPVTFCGKLYFYYASSSDTSKSYALLFDSLVTMYVMVSIWILGIVSNFINIAVFGHKNMEHPINLIFWWISISDLLELGVFALYQWSSGWYGEVKLYIGNRPHSYLRNVFLLTSIYLLQVCNAVSVGLNIMLAFWRYMAIAHPLVNNRIPCNNHNVKLAVIWLYTLSFITYLPVWYILGIYELGMDNTYRIEMRGTQPEVGPALYTSTNILVNVSIIICGFILRVGPLIILVILSALLIHAAIRMHRNRQHLGVQVSQISETQRRMNRINVTIIIIVIMFLITEIPFGFSSLLTLNTDFYCSHVFSSLLEITILFNSSYNIFCYLITSKQYKKTLRSFWKNSTSTECVVRHTNLELRPLRT